LSPSRAWLVVAATSAMMVFASATVFSSMGIALFAMAGAFHWSAAEAGAAFTILIVACSLSHVAPVPLIGWIGARWTMTCGGAILALACLIAASAGTLWTVYGAAALLGIGFSLVANTPAIYLIAGWFGVRAPRMIGVYMMIGTLGGAVGPPVAHALIASAGGWRFYWAVMGAVALSLTVACAGAIREPNGATSPRQASTGRLGYWKTLRSSKFIILAVAMVLTQTCIITVSGVTPAHFSRLGWSSGFAALILGLQGLTGTLATGLSGWLTERFEPRLMLAAGLLSQTAAMALLGLPQGVAGMYAFAIAFGVGWSVSCLAITVLLVRYFGPRDGTSALATIFTFAGAAAIGPSAAGLVADATGGFSLALLGLGALAAPVALAVLTMTTASRPRNLQPAYEADFRP
jgi:MFS family permease